MAPTAALHLKPPFRAEHIGSLLRPSKLLLQRRLFEDNKSTLEELKAVENEAIEYVVKLQQEVGMKTITDGEMRR
jgi:methionine synthase II (cobalamin-independent)